MAMRVHHTVGSSVNFCNLEEPHPGCFAQSKLLGCLLSIGKMPLEAMQTTVENGHSL